MLTRPSGLRVAWDASHGMGTGAIGIFVEVGSRDEQIGEWGAAHFLEHAVFKGAGPYSGRELAERADGLGAEINAFTTRDYTCFYGKALDPDLPAMFDLLCAMVSEPWLLESDLERERTVIAAEMAESRDDLDDRAEEGLMQALIDDPGFSHEILGTPASVAGLARARLARFHARWYHPRRMAVAIAGADAARLAQELAWERVGLDGGQADPETARARPRYRAEECIVDEDHEQVHVLLGVPAPDLDAHDLYATDVLVTVLGGQNSSRLWQRLREREGIVYGVDASYEAEPDWGTVSIGLAVAPDLLERALAAIGEELDALVEEGPGEEELIRARRQLRASLRFGLESVEQRMIRLGRHVLAGGLPPSVERVEAAWAEPSAKTLTAVAENLLGRLDRMAVSAVGPLGRRTDLRHSLRRST